MGELAGLAWQRLAGDHAGARWWWHRQLKKPFFGRFMRPWQWPSNVAQQGWQRVAIRSASCSTLVALLRETPALRARGVVVCAHPMGLAAKGFWLRNGHSDALLDAGFHVLAYDFNGFGESPSTNFDWPADALAAGRWARQRFPELPVHALTASFGANHTLNAVGAADFPYQRIVAEGCSPTLSMFWRSYPLAYTMFEAMRLLAPATERRLRSELGMARLGTQTRVLLIHSHADRWTPVSHGDQLAAAASPSARVERLVLQTAEHTHGMRDQRDVYWSAVQRFLCEQ